jgi:hypothetical protein
MVIWLSVIGGVQFISMRIVLLNKSWGVHTNGFLVFTPEGKRYFVALTGGDAKAVVDSIKAAE